MDGLTSPLPTGPAPDPNDGTPGDDPRSWPRYPPPPAIGKAERALVLALFGALLLIYIPFAGNYGLWDPWETHYGEVARQMVERNDWISLWWPGSPQDQATFFSKPVLTFWLMAISLKLFGLGQGGVAHAADMVSGWRAEWALRLPFVLLGVAAIGSVYYLVRRTVSRGAALWSAAILATSTQWALISRQAMTDMAFVGPMTIGLCFAGLAMLLPREEVQRALPRRAWRLGPVTISWPHDRAFYLVMGLFALLVVPQLLVNLIQLKTWSFYLLGRGYRTFGFLTVLPFVVLFLVTALWIARARDRRAIYLWVPFMMGGLATLAKGPAGIALPVITVLLYLVATWRARDLLGQPLPSPPGWARWLHDAGSHLAPSRLREGVQGFARLGFHEGGTDVLRGTLIFLCVAVPWYAAMWVRHGNPFLAELIGDNYVNRAQGRHGDRGTYEYYLRQLALGLFPWSGLVAAAVLAASRWMRGARESAHRRLVVFALVWFLVDFMVVSLVNTKFHHYILPALPALAILGGLLLDEIGQGLCPAIAPERSASLWLLGVPIVWLAGRDLANFPARIGWLFNYDYVNVPVSGRPWPLVSLYGGRYEFQGQVMVFAGLATLLMALLAGLAARDAGGESEVAGGDSAGAMPDAEEVSAAPPPWAWLVGGGAFLGLLAIGIAVAPSPEVVSYWSSSQRGVNTLLPWRLRLGWLVPSVLAGLWLLGGLTLLRRRVLRAQARALSGAGAVALALVLFAGGFTCWVLDRFLVDVSPHWSQKHVFATYYRLRQGPQEPVVAYQMYWRGENLYTQNQIYDHRLAQEEKTVFLQDKGAEKLQAYLKTHRGRRIFFLLERHRLESLRGLLPAECRESLKVVDESNNKVYLAVAQL